MFPPNFSSQKEYDAYFACISNLKPGDNVEFTSNYGKVEGFFLFKELINVRSVANNANIECYNLLIGTGSLSAPGFMFYVPSPIEKRRYLAPAKKACPKILIGSTNIYWVPASVRIEKIVKYNGVQEEKEKKEKAKAAKPIRARSKHA
jgi:hypothetical protein